MPTSSSATRPCTSARSRSAPACATPCCTWAPARPRPATAPASMPTPSARSTRTTPASADLSQARGSDGPKAAYRSPDVQADRGSRPVQVNLLVLCDAANVSREGKLNVLGEFDSIHAAAFPLAYPTMVLVVRVEGHATEAGEHQLRLRLLDEDGGDVVPALEGAFPLGPPPYPGAPIRSAPLILQLHGVRFNSPGHHSFELLVDGQHLRSLPLHVMAAPDPGGQPAPEPPAD